MKRWIVYCLGMFSILYALLHFTTMFFPIYVFEQLLAISGLGIFLFTLLRVSFKKFKLPLLILIAGTVILVLSDTNLREGYHYGMMQMRGIVGFLIVIPLISWVLREEPYIEDIMAVFAKVIYTSKRFYLMVVAYTQILAYFLLFGSIAMMHQFVSVILKDQTTLAWENYKATALLRGFALSTMWVISIPSFIYAVETLGASLWIAILQGMFMAILGTLLAVLFAHFAEKKYAENLTPGLQIAIRRAVANASPPDVRSKKVIEFFLLFITLFGSIFLLHELLQIKLMMLIPMVIIFWILGFFTLKKKLYKIPHISVRYFKYDVIDQSYQLSLMLAVGVLIYALNQTKFSAMVVETLSEIEQVFPFINVLFLLPFIIIFLGFIGLGPLTVMVLVAGILESMSFPYPPELIVLAITSGSVISIMLSPLIMPVIILSSSNGLGLVTNGLKFNWKFAIAFYIIVQVYLQSMIHLHLF